MGMEVVQGNSSKWSFSTIKMNNPDFSKSDLRILDDKGEPSFEGRVEFRVDGKWGTVSNEGTTDSFARLVCRTLLYKDGDKLNNKKSFCSSHKNSNYCGFIGQKQVYTKFNCSEGDTQLSDCTKEQHGGMSHDEDVIVKCSNIDSKNLSDV
jgi:hypothetical protein